MSDPSHRNSSSIDTTIHQRVGVGANALVHGWQSMLDDLLRQMRPYLKPSHIITFAQMTEAEQTTYTRIVERITLPKQVCGVFMPPSVRNQILYSNQNKPIPDEMASPSDDGVLLFADGSTNHTIVNVLLAHPPYAAAVDVYQNGALLAGYVYADIDACLKEIGDVVRTYLDAHAPGFSDS